MRSRSGETWRAADETFVHQRHLKEVLGQCSSFQVVIVSFANSAQKAHGTRPTKLELKHSKHEPLCFENFIHCVTSVDHVHNLLHRWTVDFLVFGGNEDGRRTNKLQFAK